MRHIYLGLIALLAACNPSPVPPVTDSPASQSEPVQQDRPAPNQSSQKSEPAPAPLVSPRTEDLLADEFAVLWKPWTGDLDGIVERRVLRVLLPYGGYQFYFQNGRPRGATWEMLTRLEGFINEKLERRNVRVFVLPIPVSRDQLIPGLIRGGGDLVATDLTITPERESLVSFTRPLLTDIREVVVLGPTAGDIQSLEDLAGREIFVRASSSYAEHLRDLDPVFTERGLQPPVILPADEILESEDLLEMVRLGVAGITIMDEYKARFWAEVIDGIEVRGDLVIREGGEIAWAVRNEDEQLAALLDTFLRKYGKGSAFGNDVYKRYLKDADRISCADDPGGYGAVAEMVKLFRKYGDQYDFDWLMLAAQGFQESGLRQDRKSPAGAIGVMQIKPSTAADRNVGIDDVTTLENNIHAGARYLRFIADRYYDKPEIHHLDRWLFSLAAYNAGPARVNRHRRQAAEKGYDPNKWFDNVEIISAHRIGRETVTYVSNIYRYYIGYQLSLGRYDKIEERYGDLLPNCGE